MNFSVCFLLPFLLLVYFLLTFIKVDYFIHYILITLFPSQLLLVPFHLLPPTLKSSLSFSLENKQAPKEIKEDKLKQKQTNKRKRVK